MSATRTPAQCGTYGVRPDTRFSMFQALHAQGIASFGRPDSIRNFRSGHAKVRRRAPTHILLTRHPPGHDVVQDDLSCSLDRIGPIVVIRPNDERGVWQVEPIETASDGDNALGMAEFDRLARGLARFPDVNLIPRDEGQFHRALTGIPPVSRLNVNILIQNQIMYPKKRTSLGIKRTIVCLESRENGEGRNRCYPRACECKVADWFSANVNVKLNKFCTKLAEAHAPAH